ncbi:MAG: hypothetical protein JWM91_859 [Rhodospirillales bacterium]|nr:hypothetical protein [Rhodospirillales bacterium]
MTACKVVHDTIVIERRFAVSPARVFAAWSDPNARDRWDVPGDDWVIAESEHDFRVGGREYSYFGPRGAPRYSGDGTYLRIIPDSLIVMAGTMSDETGPMSASLSTVEFQAGGPGTLMRYTEQSAFMGDETAAMRIEGWTEIFDRLEVELKG